MFHEKGYMHSEIEKWDTDTDVRAHTHMHTAGNADFGWCPTSWCSITVHNTETCKAMSKQKHALLNGSGREMVEFVFD